MNTYKYNNIHMYTCNYKYTYLSTRKYIKYKWRKFYIQIIQSDVS